MRKITPIIFISFLISGKLYSQAIYKSLGGSWNSALSWTLDSGIDGDADGKPDSNDEVIIEGNTINLDINVSCEKLTINALGILNFNTNSRTLTVNTDLTLNDDATM